MHKTLCNINSCYWCLNFNQMPLSHIKLSNEINKWDPTGFRFCDDGFRRAAGFTETSRVLSLHPKLVLLAFIQAISWEVHNKIADNLHCNKDLFLIYYMILLYINYIYYYIYLLYLLFILLYSLYYSINSWFSFRNVLMNLFVPSQ